MFEKLQELMGKTPNEGLKPPRVSTLEDIKSLVTQFAPSDKAPDVPVSTVMVDGQQKWLVTANTASQTRRDVLINGLTQVKNAMALAEASAVARSPIVVNGREMAPARVRGCVVKFQVDEFIDLWLGAKRDGLYVVWELSDGNSYRYDVFEHKLTRGPR